MEDRAAVAGPVVGGPIVRLRTPEGVRYHAWWPAAAPRGLIVAVHGISRDAAAQARWLAPAARATGYALVAPRLPRGRYRGYQRLRSGADRAVESVVEEDAARRLGCPFTRFVLAGYSGGAQFAHRYAWLWPGRVGALVLGAAGWYTWPDPALPWPLGIAPGTAPVEPDTKGFLALPVTVVVGDADRSRDASLNTDPRVERLQGHNRLERARRWVAALQAAGGRVRLLELAGVGHDFEAAARAGLTRAVAEAARVAAVCAASRKATP